MTQEPAKPAGAADAPWWASFPAPQHTAPLITAAEVFAQLSHPNLLLVDVRRTDFEGGTISGSLNLPAQSFYVNRSVLYRLCKGAGIQRVAFYCGSSSGRGPRCSGWFADYIAEQRDSSMQALTLAGGIKGWVAAGHDYVAVIEGYDGEYWKQFVKDAVPGNAQLGLEASKNT